MWQYVDKTEFACHACTKEPQCHVFPRIECERFERDTSKPLTQSENTPGNGANAERVNENEPKNIDSFENKEVSRRDKIASVQAYCKNKMDCHGCIIKKRCFEMCFNEGLDVDSWNESSDKNIDTAYELIKDKSLAETTPHMSVPGTATSATHYQILQQQPIEIMQRLMTHEQFIGFLWGNCIKYALRLGHKDDTASDAGKLAQYARWLAMVENGETIKP